jgi:TRAP-type C4-dicarboxylate transport system permease small subunit
MDSLLKRLRTVLYWVSVGCMSAMLCIIFMQVVTRYVFGYTYEWSEELARFLFVWVVFLGSALIMGEGGHLAVTLLVSKLKGRPSGTVLQIFINSCSYIFIGLLFTQGWKMTSIMSFQTSPGMGLSMSYVYSIIPISAVLMLLYTVRDTLRIIADARGKNSAEFAES